MGIYNLIRLGLIFVILYTIRIFWCKHLLKGWLNNEGIKEKRKELFKMFQTTYGDLERKKQKIDQKIY